jgi:hypothetical protein
MELMLIRKYDKLGTNGTLYKGDDIICHTIELPWKENQKMISCIPEGRYEMVKRYNDKFKWHFILMNVPNRAFILIHPATMAYLDDFKLFEKIVKFFSEYKLIKMSELNKI